MKDLKELIPFRENKYLCNKFLFIIQYSIKTFSYVKRGFSCRDELMRYYEPGCS
jgi:hypothetical protein